MNEAYPMTRDGKIKIEKELKELKEVKTKKIRDEIKEHRKFCDFKENASFDQLLDEEALLKKKILDLENQLALAEIVEKEESDSTIVQSGDEIKIKYVEDDHIESYQIVGENEADLLENKISFKSPIGQSSLGKKIGESWEMDIPAGKRKVKLIDVN